MTANRLETLLSEYFAGRERPSGPSPEDLCRDCPELLPELRKRIAAVEIGDSLLKSTGAVSGPDTAEYVAEFPARLGPYAVKAVLGRGGMGAVLLADDPGLGRPVAIKVMLPGRAADPVARDRFLREAKAAAAVRHDHVVPIYHVGDEDGVPFLVMPLLEGESLAARLKRGPLPAGEVARIGQEAALGLAAAHAKGLVHRDVKPANLWLEAPNGRVLVLDFGLARAANRTDGLTASGGVLGTPAYMAPEQADGREIDARADLFSLGATLYEAVTRVCPFQRPTLTATLRAVAEDDPPPPAAINPAVPPALSELIVRLLVKRPSDRPPSAVAVAAALAAIASEAGTATTAEYNPAPARPWRSRAVVCVGLALLVITGLGVWLATRGEPAPQNHTRDGATPAPVPAPAPAVPAAPLKGSVDLLVYRVDRTGSPVLVPLSHPLATPLRTGDNFKIVAGVNRPAHLYLFWVDENGKAVPVYPWTPGKWGTRPAAERSVTELDLKAPNGKAFSISGDDRGMETILMFARSSPLDASEADVKAWFDGLKPLKFNTEHSRAWFEDFELVAGGQPTKQMDRAFTDGERFDVLAVDVDRGVLWDGDVRDPDGPVGLQMTLERRIGKRFELARAISFSRLGRSK